MKKKTPLIEVTDDLLDDLLLPHHERRILSHREREEKIAAWEERLKLFEEQRLLFLRLRR